MIIGRSVLIGAAMGAVAGGAVGLVLGLIAYPPTAVFAIVEVGLPAAAVGAVIGVVHGTIGWVRGRRRGAVTTRRPPS